MGEQAKKLKELDLKDYVPAEYHEFLTLFSETLAKNLPPHWPYDHKIPLREGFTPPFGPLYSMSRTELQMLKVSRSYLASPCCSTGNVVLVAARPYSVALWWYLALP